MNGMKFMLLCLVVILAACTPGDADSGQDQIQDANVEQAAPVLPAVDTAPSAEAGVHTIVPGDLPEETINHAGDQDASEKAEKKLVVSGDRFTFGQFERPFNEFTMDQYFGAIDLQDFTLYRDDTFMYASVIVHENEPGASPADRKYALEFDLDLDGRGDVLVIFFPPASTDWTTDGIQAWVDSNEDVGGVSVINADSAGAGDGYEELIFDQGEGIDPDAAWARISPDDPNTIHFAVRFNLFGGVDINPAQFDLNDHYTHEQAGAAITEFEFFYPIKELSELDNTCRLNFGFTPNGTEPGMCPVPGVQKPNEPGAPSTCSISCPRGTFLDAATCSCVQSPN
jgi:hypothetical protein